MKTLQIIAGSFCILLLLTCYSCNNECSDEDPFFNFEFRPAPGGCIFPVIRPECPPLPNCPNDEPGIFTSNPDVLDKPHMVLSVSWGCSNTQCGQNGRVFREFRSNDQLSGVGIGSSFLFFDKIDITKPIQFNWNYRSRCLLDRCDPCNSSGQFNNFYLDTWREDPFFISITAAAGIVIAEFHVNHERLVCNCEF